MVAKLNFAGGGGEARCGALVLGELMVLELVLVVLELVLELLCWVN